MKVGQTRIPGAPNRWFRRTREEVRCVRALVTGNMRAMAVTIADVLSRHRGKLIDGVDKRGPLGETTIVPWATRVEHRNVWAMKFLAPRRSRENPCIISPNAAAQSYPGVLRAQPSGDT